MHRWGNKKDMAGDDPPYLSVGTEVSAKYKGAFCEAKIRKVVKTVKCKVQYKNEQGSTVVSEDQIKGVLMSGASVEVKLPDKKDTIEGIIVKIQDLSQYTVVFDDGDIATLRRTALCLKSGRHFAESDTLDQLPLTHPEHFSTPVVSGVRGSRRRDEMEENSDDDEKREPKVEREEDMGKVVCVEIGDKKKTKDNWFPGLIVAPNAQDSVKIEVEDEYLVRSFKDGRYYTVPKSEATEFTREIGAKVDNPTLKQAVEKAISFLDKSDLPPHWDRDQLFGMTDFVSDIEASDTDSTDDEPREEKDHFVAQLYKFMDDRGTPINRGPVISSKDVDLYKLFKIVYKLGGYNRVTNRNQWKSVTLKMGYGTSQTNNVKSSYKKFLHSFEDFYRKLGCTLLTTSTDNKLRSRSSRPLIRDRDRAPIDKFTDKDENNSSNNNSSSNNSSDDNVAGVDAKVLRSNSPQDKVAQRANKKEDEGGGGSGGGDGGGGGGDDDDDDDDDEDDDEDDDVNVKDDEDDGDEVDDDEDDDDDAINDGDVDDDEGEDDHRLQHQSHHQQQVKKQTTTKLQQQQQPNTYSNLDSNVSGKDDEKFNKKKLDGHLVRSFGQAQSLSSGSGNGATAKEKDYHKKINEKKTSKEAAAAAVTEKKVDKSSLKMTKAKKQSLKTIDKRSGKMEVTSPYRSKRSLKDKVKDMVHKLKLKSTSANNNVTENDKKKRLTAEELSKMTQFGVKVKSKDELLNNGLKTRKLSIGGSANDKNLANVGVSGVCDKKSSSSNQSAGGGASDSSGYGASSTRPRRNDEDSGGGGYEGYKRKSVTRKRRDDDKFSNSSTDLLINQAIDFVPHYKSICIGDRLKVYYEPTHESKVTYEAKVTNKRYGTATEYLVHYTGWNTRYDEWIRRSRIADNLSWTPTRTKKKGQPESQSENYALTHQIEAQSQQNVNGAKVSTDKPKRSSVSPVSKNFAKNSIKSGLKQIRRVKKQFESKAKKAASAKDTDSSSETDSENSKKPELQKTRSRTVKQKQQEADTPCFKESAKESDSKKKTSVLKRTRSGSLKLESNEPPKRRKFASAKTEKPNKITGVGSSLRHSIKTLVSGNKRSNRIRDLSKDSKPRSSDPPSNDDSVDAIDDVVSSDKEVDEVQKEEEPNKKVTVESVAATAAIKTKPAEEQLSKDMLLVLEIPPLNAEKIAKLEADASFAESDSKAGTDSDSSSINVSPPVLKKEVLTFDEMNNIRIGLNQSLATSYLAENLDSKPKMVKSSGAKLKKEGDEQKMSPSKLFSRSPNEKLAAKTLAGDTKEKTFFPSRIVAPPAEKGEKCATVAAKKFDLCGDNKDKKEAKIIRSVTTLTSYLNMDKIDSIKKVVTTPEKSSPDKSSEKVTAPSNSPAAKLLVVDSSASSCADDVYEFKEPEPLEDRTILHRRPGSRLFEDGNAKRPKLSPTASTSDVVMRESDDGKGGEEVCLEVKPILEFATKDVAKSVDELPKCETVIVESVSSCGKSSESSIIIQVESKELVTKSTGEVVEVSFAQPLQILTETVVGAIIDDTLKLDESFPLIESLKVGDDEEEDEGTDETKLVILESSVSGVSAILSEDCVETVTSSTTTMSDVQTNSDSDLVVKKKTPSRSVVDGSHDKVMQYIEASGTDKPTPASTSVVECEVVATPSSVTDDSVGGTSGNSSSSSKVVALDSVEKYKRSDASSPAVSDQDATARASVAVPDSTASSPVSETKSKTCVKSEDSSNEDGVDESSSSLDEEKSKSGFVPRHHHSIIDVVEIEVVHSGAADAKKSHPEWKDDKVTNTSGDCSKVKTRTDDEDVSNDLLLCEETIPKSPESKEPASAEANSLSYASGSRLSSNDSSVKSPMREISSTKSRKKGRSSAYGASENATFENTPPTTPEESGSTPATSPSDENVGFSSPAFSLNEKLCSNKENERSSDNAEKPSKGKKFSEDDDSFVKRKEKDLGYKSDDPPKKRTKNVVTASLHGSEKDDFSDGGISPKASTSSPRSSVAALLAECPRELDSNQRIEYLEQKLHTIRKAYNTFKQEVASIDRRRKKLRRKEREGRMMTRNEANSLL